MRTKNWPVLVGFIALCEVAGLVGVLFAMQALSVWYTAAVAHSFGPIVELFGTVWMWLGILMGVSGFLVWRRHNHVERRLALLVFCLQLSLIILWSVLFFSLQEPMLALIEITALWLAIIWTTARFYKISKSAAWLMLPYLGWLTFASYLNYVLWTLG